MKQKKSLGGVFKTIYPALAVFVLLVAFACIFDTFSLPYDAAAYNLLLMLPVFGLVLMMFRRFHVSVTVTALVCFALFYADQLVYSLRLTHIRLSDLMLIGQAARVAGRYRPIWSFEMTRRLVSALALCGFLAFVAKYYRLRYAKKLVFLIGAGFFAVGALIIAADLLPHSPESFDTTLDTENRGLFYSWYCQYQEGKVVEPEGYSRARADELLAACSPTGGDTELNVIVIMNESLADYSLLGETPFADPLPNIHSCEDNFFYGKLAVSVYGGGTSSTEYEFLTGHSMAFLPDGSVPYLQFVTEDENSLARDLGALGYSTTAVHPYYAEEWNRTQVFRFLGFDRFLSGADFGNTVVTGGMRATAVPSQNLISFGEGPLYVRGLISDQSCYERVLEESGGQSFLFAVTMQNHGGYTYTGEDFVNTEYVTEADRIPPDLRANVQRRYTIGLSDEDPESELCQVNQYLSCLKLSDDAFKMLTDALEASGRKTIVLMFGDHQPSLRVPEHFMQVDGFTETMYYDVPYLLWANFDIEFDAPAYTSPNYLSAILKKNAGLPLSAWDQFRLDMMAQYPVVSAYKVLDKDYNAADPAALRDYAIVQYRRMFDA